MDSAFPGGAWERVFCQAEPGNEYPKPPKFL